MNSPNSIKLGEETFPIESCCIWGYLGMKDGAWYCRWGFSADGRSKSRRYDDGDEEDAYDYELKPQLRANTVPIKVERWRDLDGVSFTTGEYVEIDSLGHEAFYTIQTMSPHETSSNNRVSIDHLQGNQFRLQWTGEAYIHGIDATEFQLDAIAVLNEVTLSSEVDSESDVSDDEIGRIFATVFPHGDFTQHPAKIRSFTEDGERHTDFTASFAPK